MSWESQGVALLAASLLRPLALAVAAWLMLRALRVRHPASQHAVWTTVLIGMMLLPVLSVMTPHWKAPVLQPPRQHERPAQVFVSDPGEFALPALGARPSQAEDKPGGLSYLTLYLAGLFAMAAYRFVGSVLLWRVISRSIRLRARLRESTDVLTPVAVGVLRPAVILPVGWRAWPASTRRAVLAHEFAHLRRHDTLVSALARLVTCVLWFHPLAWWVSRKVAELAELSCDAAVLERVNDPAGYSRILLEFADAVSRAGRRVSLPGLAMAANSGMGRRIDQVFELSGGNPRKLSRPELLLGLVGVPVMCLAATAGLGESAPQTVAQPAPSAALKFEVTSVKPCKEDPSARGGRGSSGGSSPGRIRLDCRTVKDLIQSAYLRFANSEGHAPWVIASTPIEGGPAWINSDRYTIDARPEDTPSQETMRGPMMQRLLEDRFQLKLHRETRGVPVYDLTVAKGGPKLQPSMSSCIPSSIYWAKAQAQPRAPGQELCRVIEMPKGGVIALEAQSMSLDDFSKLLGGLGRPVVDKTGIAGLFDFHLAYTNDEAPAAPGGSVADTAMPDAPIPPSIFTALKDIGLRLEPAKGNREFLVIDRVERPSEN